MDLFLNPCKCFCIHSFLQRGIPGLRYPVPSWVFWTQLPLVSFTELPWKDCLSLSSLSMSLVVLHICQIPPKSLPQTKIFCLSVVPCMEATPCFWLSLLPSSECCCYSNNGWSSSQGVQQCAHCIYIYIYLCSLRWTIDSVLHVLPNSRCFLSFFTAVEHCLVTLWCTKYCEFQLLLW